MDKALAGIEKVFYNANPKIEIVGISLSPIISLIEAQKAPRDILDWLGLSKGVRHSYKAQALILGCTHFPYLKAELDQVLEVDVVDPGQEMVLRVDKASL